MAEGTAYRSVNAGSQTLFRLASRILHLRYRVVAERMERGDVALIFPEGGIVKDEERAVVEFPPGVVHLQPTTGAPVVPIAIRMEGPKGLRRHCGIHFGGQQRTPGDLELEDGAERLRQRVIELYEDAPRRHPA